MIVLLLLFVIFVAGVALLSITFVPGFFVPGSHARRKARIAGAILAAPGLLIVLFLTILSLTIFKEPPTLSELRHDFQSNRAALEKIKKMSDEDASFSRIAPTFLDKEMPNESGRYTYGDPKAGLPIQRWNSYRSLYSEIGVKLGVQRNAWGDAFIMVASVGLLDRGHASGYLYCQSTQASDERRFAPCVLRTESGHRDFDPKTHHAAFSFKMIIGGWYAYDEGPG